VVVTERGERARARILSAIPRLEKERGYNPTIGEIARAVGLSRSATYKHLDLLRSAGQVELIRRFSGWRLV
jgi:DNA-binding transcriptional ArsR family regulator